MGGRLRSHGKPDPGIYRSCLRQAGLAADARVMASGRAKFSLNEITFGASVFAGAVEMLRFLVDGGTASRFLYTGEMLSDEDLAPSSVRFLQKPFSRELLNETIADLTREREVVDHIAH